MNILDVEDMIKGLPDQRLQQEAEAPTGQVPQFLVISEIQRRTDMRKRFADQQQQAPQGTVKDQVVQQGIAAIAPPDPQMQAAMGAPVQMAAGRGVPFSEDDPNMQYLQRLKDQGFSREDIQRMISGMFYNTADEATVQSVTDQPTSTVMPPNRQGVGSVMENIPMTDIVRPGNAAYAALDQIFGRMPTPAPKPAYTQEMYDENVGGFRNVVDQDPSRYPDIKPFPVTDVDRMYASELSKMTGETVAPQGTDPKLAARTNQLMQNEYEDLLRDREQQTELLKQIDAVGSSGTVRAIDNASSQSPKPVATGAQVTDASRAKTTDFTPEALSAILAPNAAGNEPKTFNELYGINPTDYTETKDRNRGGDAGTSVQGTGATGLKSGYEKIVEDAMRASTSDLFNAADLYGEALGLADMIENQQRPELSYKALVDEYEAETQKQLADIKSERGSQALIALGAGIARGKLGDGLSEAGKVVAASNAQKRAVEAKNQAARMGFKKSEIDAQFASEIDKQRREVEAQKVRIAGLKDYNVSQAAAEKTILGMQTNLQEFLLKVEKEEGDRLDRDALNQRAVLQYVSSAMDDLISDGMTPQQKTDIADFLIQQATSMIGVIYKGPKFSQIGSASDTGQGAGTGNKRLLFDDQGNPLQ